MPIEAMKNVLAFELIYDKKLFLIKRGVREKLAGWKMIREKFLEFLFASGDRPC